MAYTPNYLSTYEPYPNYGLSTNTVAINAATSGSVSVFPFVLDEYVSAGILNLMFTANFTTVGTSSGQQTAGIMLGIFSQGTGTNSTRIESFKSTSFSWNVTGNNSSYTIVQITQTNYTGYGAAGTTNSAGVNITSGYTGGKLVGFPINALMTPGAYWLGIMGTNSTSSINVGMTMGYMGGVLHTLATALAPIGSFSSAYSRNNDVNGGRWHKGHGVWTSAGSVTGLPSSMAFASISAAAASVFPMMKFWRT